MTVPAPTWAVHSSGWEHGDTTQSLTSDAIYAALPRAAKLGFKAICCIDWPGPTGLQREAIKRIRMRAAKLKMAFIPGLVMSAPDMQDRGSPAVWASVFAELDWWKSRGVKCFALDSEDLWGMNSQDAVDGSPTQTEQQVYQSVAAIRWGLTDCLRMGFTPLLYGPQFVTTLNLRAKLLTGILATQWPDGARLIHYQTDMESGIPSGAVVTMTGHPSMGGPTASEFRAQGGSGFYYSPAWDFR